MKQERVAVEIEKLFIGSDTLIPAVVQDSTTLQVLMLGYMNREALELTLESGRVTFFSRSRQKLWVKGETSGNFLKLISIREDCDNDTLLIMAEPAGPVCHKGTVSCFGNGEQRERNFLYSLEKRIASRSKANSESSYTASLLNSGIERICKKVGEECSEVIIEGVKNDRERLIYESADLLYHLLVLLNFRGISFIEIEKELYHRGGRAPK